MFQRFFKLSGVGIFLFALLFLTSCNSSRRILSSETGKKQVVNITVNSNQLVDEDGKRIKLILTAHGVISDTSPDTLFGSGHIQSPDDSTFYSEFEVISADLEDEELKLICKITFSKTLEFVGVMLEIQVEDLGNDHEDEIQLKFDTERKLSLFSPIEFEGPGLVVIKK